MKAKAVTGTQELLAELGLGGHSAQNWASHTMPFVHAQVCRKMTVYAGQIKAGNSKRGGIKTTGGGLRKDASLNLERFFKFFFSQQRVGM